MQQHGWDGLVTSTTRDDPHVPLGASGWELGTGRDPRKKAQSDIRDRTKDPQGVDPAVTTFVAVTARIWEEKEKKSWRDARRRERKWADVRAYDARDLELWMERAPRAHIRISEMLGRKPRDVKTPEAWWETWHAQTRPAFPRSFLLAGREGVCSALAAALARPAHQVITVLGPSSTEALAVVCASLVRDDSEAADETGTQALVVSDAHAWDRLVDSDDALVLIPTFEDADVSAALRRGHHVVVPVADDVPTSGDRRRGPAPGSLEGRRGAPRTGQRAQPGCRGQVCGPCSPQPHLVPQDHRGHARRPKTPVGRGASRRPAHRWSLPVPGPTTPRGTGRRSRC